jgi:hypothetical protein
MMARLARMAAVVALIAFNSAFTWLPGGLVAGEVVNSIVLDRLHRNGP